MFPTQREVEKLPLRDNPADPKGHKVPDLDKLEKETVQDVILNCIANYKCENKTEGFYINMIAQHVIDPKAELKDKLKKFLIEVLESQIWKNKTTKDKNGNETVEQVGLYAGWIISQVLQELGVGEED